MKLLRETTTKKDIYIYILNINIVFSINMTNNKYNIR